MALVGSDFAKFPMGSSWEAAMQTERDKFIRLMLGRLEPYGVTDEREYTEAELAALAAYVRVLFDRDGVGELEPPNFTLRSLKATRRQQQTPFSLSPSSPGTSRPSPDGTGVIGVDETARQEARAALARANEAFDRAEIEGESAAANKFQHKFLQAQDQAAADRQQVATAMHPDMNRVHNPVTAVTGNEACCSSDT